MPKKAPDTIDPDAVAIGTLLRILTLRIARLERGDAYLEGLDVIREFVVEQIGGMTLRGVDAVEAIRVKAHAQAAAAHILARRSDA